MKNIEEGELLDALLEGARAAMADARRSGVFEAGRASEVVKASPELARFDIAIAGGDRPESLELSGRQGLMSIAGVLYADGVLEGWSVGWRVFFPGADRVDGGESVGTAVEMLAGTDHPSDDPTIYGGTVVPDVEGDDRWRILAVERPSNRVRVCLTYVASLDEDSGDDRLADRPLGLSDTSISDDSGTTYSLVRSSEGGGPITFAELEFVPGIPASATEICISTPFGTQRVKL